MKPRLTLLTVVMICFSVTCYSQGWERFFSGGNGENGNDVIETTDGGYLVCGSTWSYGAGGADVYLIKTNAAGDVSWTSVLGTADAEMGNAVLQTSDGGFVVAGMANDVSGSHATLTKVDANGSLQWTKYPGYGFSWGATVSELGGNFVVTGSSGSSLDQMVALKFSPSGSVLSHSTIDIGSSYQLSAKAAMTVPQSTDVLVAADARNVQGDIVLIGTRADGTCSFVHQYQSPGQEATYGMDATTDLGFIFAGYTTSYGAGNEDAYLLRVNGGNGIIWAKTYGGTGSDGTRSVIQTNDGGFLFSASISGSGSGVIKTDANGDVLWATRFLALNVVFSKLIQTSDGGYLGVGTGTDSSSGQSGIMLIKMDATGNSGCAQAPLTFTVGSGTPTVNQSASANVTPHGASSSTLTYQSTSGGGVVDPCIVGVDAFLAEADISVYPNPAQESFFLRLPKDLDAASIHVYDLMGKEMMASIASENGHPFSIATFASGLYVVRVAIGQEKRDFLLQKQ